MEYVKLETEVEISSAIEALNSEPYVVLDTETTGLDPHSDKLLSIVVGTKQKAYSFSPEFLHLLKDLKTRLILQNFKFDFHFLKRAGVDLSFRSFRDTMLMDHIRDEMDSHGLDAMVNRYFKDNYKEEFWEKYKTYEEAPADARLEYECKDVIYTARIYQILEAELYANEVPETLIEHVHRLALELWHTEYYGVAVDTNYVTKVGVTLQTQIETLKPRMRELVAFHCDSWELNAWATELDKRKTDRGKAGVERPEFSFESSKQLSDLIYNRLRLTKQYDLKTKKLTTGDDALAKLEHEHPLIPLLREYRGHQKVYGSYIEGTLDRMRNGRIYPEFNINGTKTGRISHSNPNLGQLPSSGQIRGIYVPDPLHKIISADYQQLEVVLAAHFSRDKNLLRVVHEGVSLHDITAEGLGISRAQAKTINFALQYGAGKEKIKQILQCGDREAQYALNKYWETYSGLKALIDECHSKVNRGEPIVNPFGRRRHFPTEFAAHWERSRAHRQSFNALIQGTGGDLTSRAFYLVSEAMQRNGWGRALFTVHDEILIAPINTYCVIARDKLEYFMKVVGEEVGLTVPLSVQSSEPMERWED